MLDPASRKTMDRPFKCHLCIFSSFATKGKLVKHYRERHPTTQVPTTIMSPEERALLDSDIMITSDANETTIKNLAGEIITNENPINTHNLVVDDDVIEEINMDEQNNEEKEPEELGTASNDNVENEEDVKSQKDDVIIDAGPIPETIDPVQETNDPINNRLVLNPERDNYNVDLIMTCWKCSNTFPSRKLLIRHLKEHNIDYSFKCYLCDASYESREECLMHQESYHVTDWAVLKEKNRVSDVEQFSVFLDELINKYFTGEFDGTMKSLDVVDTTGVFAENLEVFKMDMSTADYLQRKVFCSLCPKRFWSLQDLRRHMRSHTGEKPFECDVCQRRFTLKHSMMRHKRKHFTGLPGSMSASDEEGSTGEDISIGKTDKKGTLSLESALNRFRANKEQINLLKKEVYGTADNNEMSVSDYLRRASPLIRDIFPADGSDLLHNLLGVENAAIEQMLDSDSMSAAKILGVN